MFGVLGSDTDCLLSVTADPFSSIFNDVVSFDGVIVVLLTSRDMSIINGDGCFGFG